LRIARLVARIQLRVLALFIWSPLAAQGAPGTNISFSIDVVSLVRSGDTTRVTYQINNDNSSHESLWAVTIEAPAEPFGISHPAPDTSWMIFSRYGDRPVVQWSTLSRKVVPPGASTPRLSFSARGLPAIVAAHVKGHYDLPSLDTLEDESILAQDPLEYNSVATRVVGVEPVPAGATAAILTLRLDSLTGRSCALGWINQAATCAALHAHLVTRPARLAAFQAELAKGHTPDGPVSDNAYWLLKSNADYIQRR
jgi:hypothetical protein